MFWTFSVLSWLTALDAQCQALIDANSQTLGLIRTIQVTYTIVHKENPDPRPNETIWSREGRRERIWHVGGHLEPTADGRPRDIQDLLSDGDVYKMLTNWDPKNPQKITPTKQGTVRASTGLQMNFNATVFAPSEMLLFEVDYRPRRTLRELANVSPQVICKGKVRIDGRELWLISLETPEETTKASKKSISKSIWTRKRVT